MRIQNSLKVLQFMEPGNDDDEVLTKQIILKKSAQAKIKRIQSRISEKIKVQEGHKTVEDWKSIQSCLKNHFIFYNFSNKELQNIRAHMFECQIKEGNFVYESGDNGHCFFIVKRGILELLVDDKFKNDIRPLDGFGEIALLYNTQRTSSVRARQDSILWVIDRLTFRQAVEQSIIEEYTQNRKCLEGARFFWGLKKQYKDKIAASLILKRYKKNQLLIKQGDPGSSYYYIKEGSASVFKGSKFIRKIYKGDSFGEQSLYYNTMRQLTIRADDETTVLILGRDTLNRVMDDQIYEVTFKNFIRWAFDNNSLLQRLTKIQTERLIQNMKLSNFKANQTIFRRGIVGFQKIIVVIQGQLKNVRNGSIVATKGQCFGQQYFLQENRKKTLEDEIIMQGYGVLAQLSDLPLLESMGLHRMNNPAHQMKLKKQVMIEKNINIQKIRKLKMQELIVIDEIAEGQFGNIFLMKEDFNYYCLKQLRKESIQKYEVAKFIVNEKKIFQNISHSYICSLGKTFHTPKSAYYITQHVLGEDLYEVMKKLGLLSSEDTKFYVSNILLVLQYLHNKSIIVRDIKPQNFMVDRFGFLKLMNLSIAKQSHKEKKDIFKTYTIIGTPHYMAPDIILGKGYNNMVDLWSLGITTFQFLCGYLPFGDQAKGAYQVYQQIMQNQVKFPEFFSDKKAQKFIQQLLSHNPDGSFNGSFQNMKSDIWLDTINWQALQTRVQTSKLHIPYQPNVKGKLKEKHRFQIPINEFLEEEDKKLGAYKQNLASEWSNFGELIKFN